MLRRQKEETPRGLVAGSLLTQLQVRDPTCIGGAGYGSCLTINNLIMRTRTLGSSHSAATGAMLTCGDFRNKDRRRIFDTPARVAAGRARSAKAGKAFQTIRFHLGRFALSAS